MSWSQARAAGRCVLCGRPLPPRRWWQWLTPPPLCRADDEVCTDLMVRRIERGLFP